ncbi:MAG: DNA-processing protein DprA [Cyanobacteria bacterium RUI128]|nr:DNA-processing protein DprA [Cyanobacteria bacterium RUI128]
MENETLLKSEILKKYWVGFSSVEEFDSKFILALYEYFGDIQSAYEAGVNELIEFSAKTSGYYKKKVDKFLKIRDSLKVDEIYNSVIDRGLKVLTFEDNSYPYMLKNISDPPAVLYYKGDFSVCNLERTIAIVGSRRMTRNANDALRKVMSGLAGTDLCVVSGLATGADTAAHRFALDNGLKTIGVIGGGIDNLYPSSNKVLCDEIVNGRGVVMSECFPTFEPLPFRFPQRNRIVSGLSYGTLVVEAALRSGALITANLTLEQGRELMCIPGLITNPNTAGIYKMIKTGAHIITESEDILNALNWTVNKQMSLFGEKPDMNNLSEDEQKIIHALEVEPKSFDEIQQMTGIEVNDLLTYLTTLELNGRIEQTAGDRYKL